MTTTPKYSSTFIFETKDLTDEFHRIDSEIATRAMGMDTHRLAKSRYGEWLGEYRVVISEVQSVYGTPILGLEHRPVQEHS